MLHSISCFETINHNIHKRVNVQYYCALKLSMYMLTLK